MFGIKLEQMDITPFFIRFIYHNQWEDAEVRPCCREDSVVDYAIWMKGKLVFTITRGTGELPGTHWVIALKNADINFDSELVQLIGQEIEYRKRHMEQPGP